MTEQSPTATPTAPQIEPEQFAELAGSIEREVGAFIVGQQQLVRQTLISLIAGSHALLEGVPGLGKTMLVRTMAEALDLGFSRIQFTPDLMPADIIGTNIIVEEGGERRFRFQQGPIFANLVLADEINRATPKTQSALLEAMEEAHVTVDGVTHALPQPFVVLATENPIDYEGTFPLPEAQLDRFFLKTSLGYPSLDEELQIIDDQREHHPLVGLRSVVTIEEVAALSGAVGDIYLDPLLGRWIVELVRATRELSTVAVGASVRGSLALEKAARAWALLHDRTYVTPVDVERLFLPVLGHRVVFTPRTLAEARRTGWEVALAEFRAASIELAPAPATVFDSDSLLAGS